MYVPTKDLDKSTRVDAMIATGRINPDIFSKKQHIPLAVKTALVVQRLSEKEATLEELMETTGMSKGSVNDACRQLIADGKVTRSWASHLYIYLASPILAL
mmetsp:Transcript_23150/g.38092  ORF Transcript_23150/g.38092 Transcript_23150/m.38092 type:complete len:101 (-) Transcript_23150:8-310(-)